MSIKATLAKAVLIASILAGVSYVAAWNLGLPQAADLTWKGLGVGLLALYAALNARSLDGWLLVGVMAFGALGDVLLETSGMAIGGAAFLVGHFLAIALYLANRRGSTGVALASAVAGACLVAGVAFSLTHDHGVALYALGLGGMAGSAVGSRFPIAALGAVSFAFSDLMIFAALGPLAGSTLPGLVIWPTYFAGQALVAIGVVRGLQRRRGGTISLA